MASINSDIRVRSNHSRSLSIVAGVAIFSLVMSLFASLIPYNVSAAGFSYTISIADADFTGNTLTVSAPVVVTKFVGTETSQWIKINWGDGVVETFQAKLDANYALSVDGKDFSILNLVKSHTYSTNGSFSVTAKVYHGNESGNEGSADQSNTVTFQTENTLALCSDSTDNDHDGLIDLLDPDCAEFLNHAPVANDDTYNTDEDTNLTVAASGVITNDSDFESSSLTATLIADVANGVLVLNSDGSFSYDPAANFNGVDTFTYTVSDGQATSNTATVSIFVDSTNDAPVAADDAYSTDEDTVLTVVAAGVLTNDTDTDADPLTAAVESTTNDGTLSLNSDGSFTYTPDANFNGTDYFTYKANDGSLNSSAVTVTITVNAVNDAPTATPDAFSIAQGTALSNTLTGSDVEGDTLSFATTTSPTHGTLVLNAATGEFTYTPDDNTYTGSDSFEFTVNDGALTSAAATIAITVTATTEDTEALCSDTLDNDFDGATDLDDSDCAAFVPVVTPPTTGGGSNGGGNGGGGGGGSIMSGPLSIGFVNTNPSTGGQVLGASTELPAGCSAYMGSYLKKGSTNSSEVKKLQSFLNTELGLKLPVTGIFGNMTLDAVNKFQTKYSDEILKPWFVKGLSKDTNPSGYVYKTTKYKINKIVCASLNTPEPQLP